MAHYLVTGGAGFIGSNLAHALVERGEQVRILDNFATGREENIAELVEKQEGRARPRRHHRRRGGARARSTASTTCCTRRRSRRCRARSRIRSAATTSTCTAPCTLLDARAQGGRQARGVRRVVVGVRREDAGRAEGRDHDAGAAVALRGGQARLRVLPAGVLSLVRARDGGAALLQHLRAAPGSEVAVRGGDPELRDRGAAGAARRPSSATARPRATSASSRTPSRRTCSPAPRRARRARCSTSPAASRRRSIRPSTSSRASSARRSRRCTSRRARATSSTRSPTSARRKRHPRLHRPHQVRRGARAHDCLVPADSVKSARMKSMTGYGRGTCEVAGRRLVVELRSVNHRFLELKLRLPWADAALEAHVTAAIRARLGARRGDGQRARRGRRRRAGGARRRRPGAAVSRTRSPSIRSALGSDEAVTLALVAAQPGVITVGETVCAIPRRCGGRSAPGLDAALDALLAARGARGRGAARRSAGAARRARDDAEGARRR